MPDINIAARRIALTKFSNAGQMCVAPDYVLVHQSVKAQFINALKAAIAAFYGPEAAVHYNYGRIINRKQFDRIVGYMSQGKIIYGGNVNADDLYIEPTLMDDITTSSTIMQEEIFGPLLPILSFNNTAEALDVIAQNPNPLAFYVFTSSKEKEEFWLKQVAFGGAA